MKESWTKIEHSLEMIPLIIHTCCILHNLCEQGRNEIIPSEKEVQDVTLSSFAEYDGDNRVSRFSDTAGTEVRTILTSFVTK